MNAPTTPFKAYDVRGRVPEELNEDLAYRIGRAYAIFLAPDNVVVGRDNRLTSEAIAAALGDGLRAEGADVYDIGVCGTEQVYFTTQDRRMGGGIMVTASHNPKNYNGMKFVRERARPISGDTGLRQIQRLAERNRFLPRIAKEGGYSPFNNETRFITHLLSHLDRSRLEPLKLVVNAGNGVAGRIIDQLEPYLPFQFIKVHHESDGTFPNGVPNPLLPGMRGPTARAVVEHGADMGFAWDGDFDRCFLFDENGKFVEGYYIVGLLAQAFLKMHPGATIVHDPRLTWNTVETVRGAGGVPVVSKTGHAFIKEAMRREDAVYGGEMSGHHYFRSFAYCDSGMIPWLLVAQRLSEIRAPLSELVGEHVIRHPASGEINRQVSEPARCIERLEQAFGAAAESVDYTDGLSMEFRHWRFNVRSSNTEPLVRLNVESRSDRQLMLEKTEEVLTFMEDEQSLSSPRLAATVEPR